MSPVIPFSSCLQFFPASGFFLTNQLHVRWLDKILVLSGGKIVEAGDHNELLKLGGKYTRMVQSDEYEFRNGGKISG